jgi:integrase
MERRTHILTAKAVESAKDGWHKDGGNLYLRVADGGQRRHWVFRWTRNDQTREMGLGAAHGSGEVSLALARQKRDQAMEQIANGLDPLQEKQAAKHARAAKRTFREVAEAVLKARQSGWRTSTTGRTASFDDWQRTLLRDAKALHKMHVDEIGVDDVKAVAAKFWSRGQHTSAKRTLGRIALTFDYAIAHGWRSAANPASWAVFVHLSPRAPNGKQHRAAVEWKDLPPLMPKLRTIESMGALTLEFMILTGTRSLEARGALWSEISPETATWTVPGIRMKRGIEFIVPLSEQVVALLRRMETLRTGRKSGELVFPGQTVGMPLRNEVLGRLVARLTDGGPAATVHGFRSSFRSWMADHGTAFDVAEACLAHSRGTTVEAYQRSQMVERRRPVYQQWADFLDGVPEEAKVVPIAQGKRR